MLDWSQCPAVELVLTTTNWLRIRSNVTLVAAAVDSMKSGDYRELSFKR